MVRSKHHILVRVLVVFLLSRFPVMAGPPFITDDPQPVDYLHWELYFSSAQFFGSGEISATLPHIEINYGALPDVQLHLILPMGFVNSDGISTYGFSNTEFGIKYRFIEETNGWPQIGTFPLIEIPTASNEQNLGSGQTQIFLPLWMQKSWGSLTTYGGGGFWYNPGEGNKNYFFIGCEIQNDFSKKVTLGGELFFHTATTEDEKSDAGCNLGGIINFDETNHLLFSFGHNFIGTGMFTGYIGYQLTI
ncbi:MAG: hypothetical protein ABSB78_06895 [Bacteroidota bacterium]